VLSEAFYWMVLLTLVKDVESTMDSLLCTDEQRKESLERIARCGACDASGKRSPGTTARSKSFAEKNAALPGNRKNLGGTAGHIFRFLGLMSERI
jgi:hypothetical protein